MYIGYDIGSSSVKASLVEVNSGNVVASAQFPQNEMGIISNQPGWAEQDPEEWWKNVCDSTWDILKKSKVDPREIKGIGIAYQMHGLVLVDKNKKVLRPSIIWCDSRAVEIGQEAFNQLGKVNTLDRLLNSPGNFTASRLKWLKDNEPGIYSKIFKILLPGDYIAMKFTDDIRTTISGLSEAILWDFKENKVADFLLDHFGFDADFIPDLTETFGNQGSLSAKAAEDCGLQEGTPLSYRAGDQPNNALSLGVFSPGDIVATGGTSGVVYGVVDHKVYDEQSRVNNFAHVNHTAENPRIGVLLCINGAGILYRWMKNQVAQDTISFEDMEKLISSVPVNSDGLRILPFGNGAERMLQNKNTGASIINLQFNSHRRAHLYRASLEGIAYSFNYGIEILNEMGLNTSVIRVGNDNLFQSEVFATTLSNVAGCSIEVINTTGATGAAKAAAYGLGVYDSLEDVFSNSEVVTNYQPEDRGIYLEGYKAWKSDLERMI